jgi:hypothetical protein
VFLTPLDPVFLTPLDPLFLTTSAGHSAHPLSTCFPARGVTLCA